MSGDEGMGVRFSMQFSGWSVWLYYIRKILKGFAGEGTEADGHELVLNTSYVDYLPPPPI